jgi:hypothetical protein
MKPQERNKHDVSVYNASINTVGALSNRGGGVSLRFKDEAQTALFKDPVRTAL